MTQMKSYIKPCITVIGIDRTNMLCSSSYDSTMRHVCSEQCKFWHICQDREIDKFCRDKKYK